ncbi:MAG: histidine kinase, partial [Lachnospiraceae bacterium]|nr:histidine kinase [Lachnospiraceae bacterium]
MEGNDNYSIFENPEDLKISFFHSFGFKVLIFAFILLAYGMIIFSLFAGNMISISDEMQSISEYQSSWYIGNAAVSAAQMNLRNYMNLSGEEYLESYQEAADEIALFIDLLNESSGVYAHDLAALCESYIEAANQAIEYESLRDMSQTYAYYEETEEIQSLISMFSSYSMVEMEETVSAQFTEQNETMMSQFRKSVVLMLIVTVVIVIICWAFLHSFLNPLEKLTALAMVTTTESWEIREAPDRQKNETGLLIRAFYRMMNKISLQYTELLRKQQLESALQKEKEKNIQTEALLAKSELKVFQSKINSHFLFNTMNMISCLANLENAPRVQNAVQLLAQYLRTELDQINQVVQLTAVIDSNQTYEEIQKLLVEDRNLIDIEH